MKARALLAVEEKRFLPVLRCKKQSIRFAAKTELVAHNVNLSAEFGRACRSCQQLRLKLDDKMLHVLS